MAAEIEQRILNFVQINFNGAEAAPLTPQTELFAEGIVDSIGVLTLVRFIESEFSIRIEPQELLLDNFSTVRAMSSFVVAKLRADSPGNGPPR